MTSRRICHSTMMVTTVSADWFDHGLSAFQAPDFATSGLALTIRRGNLGRPFDVFVERELEEARRSHARYELVGRMRRRLAGCEVDQVDYTWAHSSGTFVQSALYGSVHPGRWFKLVVSARAAHAAAAKRLLDSILATARPIEEAL